MTTVFCDNRIIRPVSLFGSDNSRADPSVPRVFGEPFLSAQSNAL